MSGEPLMGLRNNATAAGFRVENPPRVGYQPKKYPWRVVGPEGSIWGVSATEHEALLKAAGFIARRRKP